MLVDRCFVDCVLRHGHQTANHILEVAERQEVGVRVERRIIKEVDELGGMLVVRGESKVIKRVRH